MVFPGIEAWYHMVLNTTASPYVTLCQPFYAQAEQRAAPGRPKLIITESQLSYLSDYGFKAVDMARMFDVSVATIHRRLKDFDMPISHSFFNIDNNALYNVILLNSSIPTLVTVWCWVTVDQGDYSFSRHE